MEVLSLALLLWVCDVGHLRGLHVRSYRLNTCGNAVCMSPYRFDLVCHTVLNCTSPGSDWPVRVPEDPPGAQALSK